MSLIQDCARPILAITTRSSATAWLILAFAVAACSDEARAPEAVISGPAQAQLGSVVQLDGSQSLDPDGEPLSYQWRLTRLPAESAATFNDATIANPSFPIDAPGEYTVELTVFAGSRVSAPATLLVAVAECGARPPEV